MYVGNLEINPSSLQNVPRDEHALWRFCFVFHVAVPGLICGMLQHAGTLLVTSGISFPPRDRTLAPGPGSRKS